MSLLECGALWLLIGLSSLLLTADAVLHNLMSEKELHHIFGVKWKQQVPKYEIKFPSKLYSLQHGHRYSVETDTETYDFEISPVFDLLAHGFHAVISDEKMSFSTLDPMLRHCIYRGRSTSHNHTLISLVGCGQNARGMILTPDDQIMIHPVPPNLHEKTQPYANSSDAPHVIYKRSAFRNILTEEERMEKACLFDQRFDPFPIRLGSSLREERLAVLKGPMVIELAVFADEAMWAHFKEIYPDHAEVELQKFILTAVNNIHMLFSHKSIDPKIHLQLVRYEVMRRVPDLMSRSAHQNGEVDLLLEGFCLHQNNINPSSDTDPRHWDHALLFSGYDLYRGSLKSVAGYAPVKGMCSGIRSCTINEGLDFGAVFVITHEMGHSLGMYHDGDNGCDARCCIMSPSVGTGKTRWSECSVREFTTFVNKLGTGLLPANCLSDGLRDQPVLDHSMGGILPGQRYSLDQQCRIFHGDCWKQELRDGQEMEDVCQMLWCGAGEGVIRTTHPGLEGSYCGKRKWCIEGECVPWGSSATRPVNGAWAPWNDHPGDSCGGECSECAVDGQLRVRRSMRLCDNPAPNNGGHECDGSSVRGLVCRNKRCDGPLPNQYASSVCGKLRNNADAPDLLLSGRGFQYSESPCKIWCHMTVNNFIRSVKNFPDGTPCGVNQFCMKGECMNIIEYRTYNCVQHIEHNCVVLCGTTFPNAGRWAQWSSWSSCSASCGRATRTRTRHCSGGSCIGNNRQSSECTERPCQVFIPRQGKWGQWQGWQPCGVTCGTGDQTRERDCFGLHCQGLRYQTRQCALRSCPIFRHWDGWSPWSPCSQTCGGGVRGRRRKCLASVCLGRNSDSESCNTHPCLDTNRITAVSRSAQWTEWGGWAVCSRSCGGGTMFRRRRCEGSGTCFGTSVSFTNCNVANCFQTKIRNGGNRRFEDVWSPWSSWGSCSRSCDTGIQRRTRVCHDSPGGRPCRGANSQTRSCNSQPCQSLAVLGGSEWSRWTKWSSCSVTCGRGVAVRRRYCRVSLCLGSFRQVRYCNEGSCLMRRFLG